MSTYTDNKHDPEYERGWCRGAWKAKHEATDTALADDLNSAAFKRGWDDSRRQLTEWEAQEKGAAREHRNGKRRRRSILREALK